MLLLKLLGRKSGPWPEAADVPCRWILGGSWVNLRWILNGPWVYIVHLLFPCSLCERRQSVLLCLRRRLGLSPVTRLNKEPAEPWRPHIATGTASPAAVAQVQLGWAPSQLQLGGHRLTLMRLIHGAAQRSTHSGGEGMPDEDLEADGRRVAWCPSWGVLDVPPNRLAVRPNPAAALGYWQALGSTPAPRCSSFDGSR